jgi:cobalamin biosynthesis protein CobC
MTVINRIASQDHGGGIDAAAARFGGARADWLDLSTGINPHPYPVGHLTGDIWTALPDRAAQRALEDAARQFWRVPEQAAVLAAPGASSLIARIPALANPGRVQIPHPTYNEHARAFRIAGWEVDGERAGTALVVVHPNNPDGRVWAELTADLCVIDESFCDVMPQASLIGLATRPGTIVLKSFGKFWGLGGLRLGFAIGDPDLIGQLDAMLGPWAVSGPALAVGTAALHDTGWAERTRARLDRDAARLDAVMGLPVVGGTSLFRLYDAQDANRWHDHLARQHILTRVFPWSDRWLRLGLPDEAGWARLDAAVEGLR